MTKFDNKFIPSMPKTFQVLELKDQQQPVKKSPLSVAARSKVVNRSGSNYSSANQENYGPCSYSECPWPASVPCHLEINIEGINRKWARDYGDGNWLSGYWEPGNFNRNRVSRRSLILNDLWDFRNVIPLLSNDRVYAINMIGTHCAEDAKFCNVSMDIIRKGIDAHESGHEVDRSIMLDSDISKWNRFAFKAGVAIGAGFINPGVAVVIGASTWGLSRAIQENCDSPQGKRFWGTVSDVGLNSVGSGIDGFLGKLTNSSGGFYDWSKVPENELVENIKKITGPVTEAGIKHVIHQTLGYSYDSDCLVCNPNLDNM